MTPAQFADAMRRIRADTENPDTGDKEDGHIAADKLLCDTLSELGYSEGVQVFNEMGKWYS